MKSKKQKSLEKLITFLRQKDIQQVNHEYQLSGIIESFSSCTTPKQKLLRLFIDVMDSSSNTKIENKYNSIKKLTTCLTSLPDNSLLNFEEFLACLDDDYNKKNN